MYYTPKQIADMVSELTVDILEDQKLQPLADNPKFNKIMVSLATKFYTQPFNISDMAINASDVVKDNDWVEFVQLERSLYYIKIEDYQLSDAEKEELINQCDANGSPKLFKERRRDFIFPFITQINGKNQVVTKKYLQENVLSADSLEDKKHKMHELILTLDCGKNIKESLSSLMQECKTSEDIEKLVEDMTKYTEKSRSI